MLFATRPSDAVYKELEVVDMKHFPFKGYKAMAWCGKIIHRVGASDVDERTIRHEMIHVMQAMYCNDSWVRYYLAYFWEWLKGGIILAPVSAAYYTSKYESEAYGNEDVADYCLNYDGSNLQKYVFKKRKKLYKEVGGTPKDWKNYIKSL